RNHESAPALGFAFNARDMAVAHVVRASLIEPHSRVGCTLLVSRIAMDCEFGSMTNEVPVKPVWPAVLGEDSSPMYHDWSSSNPSPCESSGNSWFRFVSM